MGESLKLHNDILFAVIQANEGAVFKMFGAAQAGHERFEIPIPPVERAEYDTSLATLCHKLGEARFEKLLAEGRAMSINTAVELALDGTGETPEIVEK